MTNRHNKTRKLNGGIRITQSFTPQTAINHFVNNSTFSVFYTRGTTSSVLEEQNTDPQYFEKLVMAQFNGLIIQRK